MSTETDASQWDKTAYSEFADLITHEIHKDPSFWVLTYRILDGMNRTELLDALSALGWNGAVVLNPEIDPVNTVIVLDASRYRTRRKTRIIRFEVAEGERPRIDLH